MASRSAEIAPRVERYLALVRLTGLGHRRPHELSGGQQQRVAIARALVFEPDLLLLDEPLAALDRKLREEMQLEFRRIQRELGVTTINVTHDQREALIMSDRVLVMDRGRVQQLDPPQETYAQPANRFVAGFLGLTNFLRGEAVAAGRVRVGETELDVPPVRPASRARRSSVAIRAERVAVDGGETRFAARDPGCGVRGRPPGLRGPRAGARRVRSCACSIATRRGMPAIVSARP